MMMIFVTITHDDNCTITFVKAYRTYLQVYDMRRKRASSWLHALSLYISLSLPPDPPPTHTPFFLSLSLSPSQTHIHTKYTEFPKHLELPRKGKRTKTLVDWLLGITTITSLVIYVCFHAFCFLLRVNTSTLLETHARFPDPHLFTYTMKCF